MTKEETKNVESEWFEFTAWDELDFMCNQYYDVSVTKHFAGYRPGERIDTIVLDFNSSTYQVYDKEDNSKAIKEGRLRIEFD